MPEQVANRLEGDLGAQQASGAGEPKRMSAVSPLHFDTGLCEPPADDRMQGTAVAEGTVGCPDREKYLTRFRLRPAFPKVPQQGLAHRFY